MVLNFFSRYCASILIFFISPAVYAQSQSRTAIHNYKVQDYLFQVSNVSAIQDIILGYLNTWYTVHTFSIDEYGAPKIAFSSDSKTVVCSNSCTKKLKKWNVITGNQVKIEHNTLRRKPDSQLKLDETFTMGFMQEDRFGSQPVHRLLVTEARDDRIILWDTILNEFCTLQELRENKNNSNEKSSLVEMGKTIISAVALSPDCKYIAASTYNYTTQTAQIKLWDILKRCCIATFDTQNKRSHLRFSPHNTYLASVGASTSPTVEIWNIKTFLPCPKIHEFTAQSIIDLQFSFDERQIIYGVINSSDKPDTIKCWDMQTKRYVREIKIGKTGPSDFGLHSVALSPRNTNYAACLTKLLSRTSDPLKRVIRIWNQDFSQSTDIVMHYTSKLTFSPCGLYLAAQSIDEKKLYLFANQSLQLTLT